MNIYGVIPARYGSTRFPGKPLAMIGQKPMIQHVVERCTNANELQAVIVATDDERISDAVESFGGRAIMTSTSHTNGTERCAEVVQKLTLTDAHIVNIQGDEPLLSPSQLDRFCQFIRKENPPIATMVRPLIDEHEIASPHVVKCVCDYNGKALYFSRHSIPYQQSNQEHSQYLQHIGMYAYRASVLNELVQLPPSSLEKAESLEQLRWLENGYSVYTMQTTQRTISVDVPSDIPLVEKELQ